MYDGQSDCVASPCSECRIRTRSARRLAQQVATTLPPSSQFERPSSSLSTAHLLWKEPLARTAEATTPQRGPQPAPSSSGQRTEKLVERAWGCREAFSELHAAQACKCRANCWPLTQSSSPLAGAPGNYDKDSLVTRPGPAFKKITSVTLRKACASFLKSFEEGGRCQVWLTSSLGHGPKAGITAPSA